MPSPLGELGWRGKYQYDSPEVVALRERLAEHNGESLRMHIVGAARLPPLSSVLHRACLAQA